MFDINWSYKHDIYNLICLPVIIRFILGPILLFLIGINIYNYFDYICYLNLLLFVVGLILNLLNFKWTIDLVNGGWKKLSDKDSKGL